MAGERVVVVGAGGISGAWFPVLKLEKVTVAGVVDLDLQRARSRMAQFELDAPAGTDLALMLKQTAPDFVIDLTVPEAHCAVTCAALKAGCHVLGEKPMAASMADARRMVAAAEKARRVFMVGQSRRWERLHDSVRKTITAGRAGTVTTVNCDFYLGAHFGGFRDQMASPLILDMAIHHFDMARFMAGADPVAVYAREFNPKGSWYQGAVAASCIFEMTNGVVFTYRGSWCAEGCSTGWNGSWRIVGDKGTLVYESDQEPCGEVVAGTTGFNRPLKPMRIVASPSKYPRQHGALREMLAWLRSGTLPQTECHDNIKSLAMVFAAIESARTGRRVPVKC